MISTTFVFVAHIHADPTDELDFQETYVRGQVLQVESQGMHAFDGSKSFTQTLKVKLLEGRQKGKIIMIGYSIDGMFGEQQGLHTGDMAVIDSKPLPPSNQISYSVYEPYRLNNLWFLLAGFIVLVIIVAGKKGVGAIIGLSISIATVIFYIIPQILNGQDPLTICIIGSVVILFLTTYIAHGVSVKTSVAVFSTSLSLALAAFIATFSVHATTLFGLGNEDVINLQLGTPHLINSQGLLLGGILIGTLGALNDITTTQSITIFTLARENPKQHFSHLFQKGMMIGREHIASLVNTLVLAYAGTSLVIFAFFVLNPAKLPWWVILNNETTMEEIMRTLIGSTALILAVPITTVIASFIAFNWAYILGTIKANL